MLISPKIPIVKNFVKQSKCVIVTGGGICPGINTVVGQLVKNLEENNSNVIGARNGYNGIVNKDYIKSANFDYNIQGSCLGMSRDLYTYEEIVESLTSTKINQLYVVGGEGSLTVAHNVAKIAQDIQVIGIPKTIDNDISVIDHSFGFYSAIDAMTNFIEVAYIESKCYNTVAIIETMGRNSGFLSAYSAGLNDHVDVCIIPENLDNVVSYINKIKTIMKTQNYCTVILCEGCDETFKSCFINSIKSMYKNTKIITPSYLIRNTKLNSYDTLYCKRLAYNAVQLSKQKLTDFAVGKVNNKYTAIPLSSIANKQRKMSLTDEIFDFL